MLPNTDLVAAPPSTIEDARVWKPQDGPQMVFHQSSADEVLYGGSAGGGKSESLLVESLRHTHVPGYHAILFRRTFPELLRADGLIPRSKQLLWKIAEWRASEYRWYFNTGNPGDPATLDFSHLEREDDVFAHQSAAYAYLGFDELTSFSESQYLYMGSRGRSTRGVPIRLRGATNPGNEGEGWVLRRWSPWLDPTHPNPAHFGEIRWFARVRDEDTEVEPDWRGPKGEKPLSRTFIQAFLDDNPALVAKDPGYRDRLDALPEPYRSQLKSGVWGIGKTDEWTIIPFQWVKEAMDRWTPEGHIGYECDAISCDPARGVDKAVIGKRFNNWVHPLSYHQQRDTMYLVGIIRSEASGLGIPVMIDIIGVGAGVYDRSREINEEIRQDPLRSGEMVDLYPVNSGEKSNATDSSGLLEFANLRAEMWWTMRELLDPTNPRGLTEPIALPPDRILLSDLTTPRWRMTSGGILVESKIDLKKRIRRSTDAGDTVIMLFQNIGRSGAGRGGIWV